MCRVLSMCWCNVAVDVQHPGGDDGAQQEDWQHLCDGVVAAAAAAACRHPTAGDAAAGVPGG